MLNHGDNVEFVVGGRQFSYRVTGSEQTSYYLRCVDGSCDNAAVFTELDVSKYDLFESKGIPCTVGGWPEVRDLATLQLQVDAVNEFIAKHPFIGLVNKFGCQSRYVRELCTILRTVS